MSLASVSKIMIVIFSHGSYDNINIKTTKKLQKNVKETNIPVEVSRPIEVTSPVAVTQKAPNVKIGYRRTNKGRKTYEFRVIKPPDNFNIMFQSSGLPSMLSVHRDTRTTMDILTRYWMSNDDTELQNIFTEIKRSNIDDYFSTQDLRHFREFLTDFTSKEDLRDILYNLIQPKHSIDTLLLKKYSSDQFDYTNGTPSANGPYRGGIYLFIENETNGCIEPYIFPLIVQPFIKPLFGKSDRCGISDCEDRLKMVFQSPSQQKSITDFFSYNKTIEATIRSNPTGNNKNYFYVTDNYKIFTLLTALFPEKIDVEWYDFSCNCFGKIESKLKPVEPVISNKKNIYIKPYRTGKILEQLLTTNIGYGKKTKGAKRKPGTKRKKI